MASVAPKVTEEHDLGTSTKRWNKVWTKDLDLSGNLTVGGTTTTIDSTTIAVEDATIKVAKGNTGADSVDFGIYGPYYDAAAEAIRYSALIRDASDSGNWTVQKGIIGDPAVNATNVNATGTLGTIKANIEATTVTATGEISAASLDISGDVDIDGTLEADVVTVNGTALAVVIEDTAGAMFTGNTETGLAATYQAVDNTVDLVIDAAQTTVTSVYNAALQVGYAAEGANVNFATDDQIDFEIDGAAKLTLNATTLLPGADDTISLGASNNEFKDAFFDGTVTADGLTIEGTIELSGGDITLRQTAASACVFKTSGGETVVSVDTNGADLGLAVEGKLRVSGGVQYKTVTDVADTTELSIAHNVVTLGNNVDITLPIAANHVGRIYRLIVTGTSVTVDHANGSDSIYLDGSDHVAGGAGALAQHKVYLAVSSGSAWYLTV
jgi:hypothetical protein